MPEDPNTSCAERIENHRAGREEDARKLLATSNGDIVCSGCGEKIEQDAIDDDGTVVWFDPEVGDSEDHDAQVCREGGNVLTGDDGFHTPDEEFDEDSLYDYGLSVEKFTLIRWQLSTGGPGDWLDIKVDADGDVFAVEYHFNDWFDHAQVDVSANSPLWELAEWCAETQREVG